ncbi:hypothetical protein FHW69_001649 [Luteibacter sp. Sphag1AF]|nr:hypothetical protein [Luteibacter sp. Sphag1AF]
MKPLEIKAFAVFQDSTGEIDGEISEYLTDFDYSKILTGFTVYEVSVKPIREILRRKKEGHETSH